MTLKQTDCHLTGSSSWHAQLWYSHKSSRTCIPGYPHGWVSEDNVEPRDSHSSPWLTQQRHQQEIWLPLLPALVISVSRWASVQLLSCTINSSFRVCHSYSGRSEQQTAIVQCQWPQTRKHFKSNILARKHNTELFILTWTIQLVTNCKSSFHRAPFKTKTQTTLTCKSTLQNLSI
jgi:hypothetical protein